MDERGIRWPRTYNVPDVLRLREEIAVMEVERAYFAAVLDGAVEYYRWGVSYLCWCHDGELQEGQCDKDDFPCPLKGDYRGRHCPAYHLAQQVQASSGEIDEASLRGLIREYDIAIERAKELAAALIAEDEYMRERDRKNAEYFAAKKGEEVADGKRN